MLLSLGITCNSCGSEKLEKFAEKKIHCKGCGALYYLMPIWNPIADIQNIES